MKLKDEFIIQNIGDTQVMVSMSGSDFNGVVKSNKTAAQIINMLIKGTTRDEIISAMLEQYDAPRDLISSDVDKVISQLRGIGAIEG